MTRGSEGGETWIERAVSPPVLFLAGMALIPAFLLQKRIDVKALQVGVLLVLGLLSGASAGFRLLWVSLFLLVSTVVFNLISPFGRVLVQLGPIVVTQGAATTGLLKGLTLVGLLLISRMSVRRSIVLPGMLGVYVSATLFYLNGLTRGKKRAEGGNLVERLDELFEAVYSRAQERGPAAGGRSTPLGVMGVSLFVAANWGLVFFAS